MSELPRSHQAPVPEAIQEAEYRFPYHHVPRLSGAGFTQSVSVRWGYLYWSYLSFVLSVIEKLEPASLLDVGCGDGRLVSEVRERIPAIGALGIDTSARAVALARAMNSGGEFRSGKLGEPGFVTETFDVITLVEVLEHVPPAGLPSLRQALARSLAAEGRLVATVPTENMGQHPKHYQHFSLDSLVAALAPDFELESATYLNRQSRLCKVFDRLLTNRYYAVRDPRLLAWLLRAYRRRYLHASADDAMRICAVFEGATGK
ncbi:MAG: class I SAM-dependent methyltransferase [Thermoanaerobaculia bacterium]